jgi:crossover junction endodeoxyribonuclease RuvC
MIILGIDPGTRYCGYAVIKKEGSAIALLACDCLNLGVQKTLPERIYNFGCAFEHLVIQWNVTDVSLETPFLGKNAQNFLKLGYIRGILYFFAQKHDLVVKEFSPREIKVTVTGYGGADKSQVAYFVKQLFPRLRGGLRDDATDALAVSLCGAWSVTKSISL